MRISISKLPIVNEYTHEPSESKVSLINNGQSISLVLQSTYQDSVLIELVNKEADNPLLDLLSDIQQILNGGINEFTYENFTLAITRTNYGSPVPYHEAAHFDVIRKDKHGEPQEYFSAALHENDFYSFSKNIKIAINKHQSK
ncbi:hypothetical protein [Vibrio sp. D431a]|uniref:hypothetical protein n=1 Tax=Vibrio sp. D431a TaxID=2837388 RepID=UPI0025567081|nr:hypothetical protein [Vibrio sp. D431a]MDK9793702.1 hypothetical protein [Vibrio sp. D431a]